MSAHAHFGDTLRATREHLGWSLEDVAHRTRIPPRALRHLENHDYSAFPGLSYAKGFLAQYAEYLGLDAVDELESFHAVDAYADLDSCGYLQDHDEHVDAKPLVMKVPARQKEKSPAKPAASTPHPPARQPLVVFSVTALLATAAVVSFMKLSADYGDEDPVPGLVSEEPLAPLPGLSTQSPDNNELGDVPRAVPVGADDTLVAGDPAGTNGIIPLNANPGTPADALVEIDLDKPPPRAVIVEE
jgi:transcriptional regulator with XRE-family HTH domain